MNAVVPNELDPSPRCRQALVEVDDLTDTGRLIDRTEILERYRDVADELSDHLAISDALRRCPTRPAFDAGDRLLQCRSVRLATMRFSKKSVREAWESCSGPGKRA